MLFKRVLGALLISVTLLVSIPSVSYAQTDYPNKPIMMIVPSPAGSGVDAMARMLADDMAKRLGQQVVIENNGGASGAIAMKRLATAKPDGYTIGFGTTTGTVIAPISVPNVGYDPIKDFAPIAGLTASPVIMVATPTAANNIAEFLALAKSSKEPLQYGTWGPGTSGQFCAEVLAQKAGVKLSHVPYKGTAPLLLAVLAGEVQYAWLDGATIAGSVKAGKIKPIAMCNNKRSPAYGNVPTYREQGVDFEPWLAGGSLLAPAGVPKPVLDKLATAAKAFLDTPAVNAKLLDWGLLPEFIPGDQYSIVLAKGIADWKAIAGKISLGRP